MTSSILFVQYTNPASYPPLEHAADILQREGWDVAMAGTFDRRQPFAMSARHIPMFLLPFEPGGWRQKLHYVWFTLWLVGLVVRRQPRWLYVSDALVCPAALVARWFVDGIVYHEHDAPTNLADSPFMAFVAWARARVVGHAALVVVPAEGRLAALPQVDAARCLVVWNTPMQAEVATDVRPPARSSSLRVLYHGTVVPARMPLTVVDALAQCPDSVTLDIVGYETLGHPGWAQTLVDRARTLGLGDRVRYVGMLPSRADVLAHAATCDVGLALMPAVTDDPNENAMAGASNKAFDYLSCGLPLVVSDRPEWVRLFVDAGVARASDAGDVSQLADVLTWYASHGQERVAMGERGRQLVARAWSYEQQFAPVLERLRAGERWAA